MPRSAELLGIAHTLGQHAQGWQYFSTFRALNLRCDATNLRMYHLNLLTETCSPHELFASTDSLSAASWLRRELEELLSPRGFALSDLTDAAIEISVLPGGDGSMFGVRVQLARHGRVFSRALDPAGRTLTEL